MQFLKCSECFFVVIVVCSEWLLGSCWSVVSGCKWFLGYCGGCKEVVSFGQ